LFFLLRHGVYSYEILSTIAETGLEMKLKSHLTCTDYCVCKLENYVCHDSRLTVSVTWFSWDTIRYDRRV